MKYFGNIRIVNYLLAIIVFFSIAANAQVFRMEDPEKFHSKRVISIETFIERFNSVVNVSDISINNMPVMSGRDTSIRRKELLSLFNLSNIYDSDSKVKSDILKFVDQICKDSLSVKLDFYDSLWYAEVFSKVIYKKQEKEISLVLVNEQVRPKVSHWAIRSVKADFLGIDRYNIDTLSIIPPNAHGTDFIGLTAKLSMTDKIENYTSQNAKGDDLSIFIYATKNNEFDFKSTERVVYHFLQVDGWILRVGETIHNTGNSGWLIEELIPANKSQKNIYAHEILNFE